MSTTPELVRVKRKFNWGDTVYLDDFHPMRQPHHKTVKCLVLEEWENGFVRVCREDGQVSTPRKTSLHAGIARGRVPAEGEGDGGKDARLPSGELG